MGFAEKLGKGRDETFYRSLGFSISSLSSLVCHGCWLRMFMPIWGSQDRGYQKGEEQTAVEFRAQVSRAVTKISEQGCPLAPRPEEFGKPRACRNSLAAAMLSCLPARSRHRMYQMQPGPLRWVQMDLESVGPEAYTVRLADQGSPFKAKNAKLGTEPWKGLMQVRVLEA